MTGRLRGKQTSVDGSEEERENEEETGATAMDEEGMLVGRQRATAAVKNHHTHTQPPEPDWFVPNTSQP
jgi:hypothetical protein